MAIRTTEGDVGDIIPLNGISAVPFIEAASLLVDDVAADCGSGYTAARLELMERWLAAHLISSTLLPQRTSKSIESASTSYQLQQQGKDLESTPYGITAMSFDANGCLKGVFAGKPSVDWVGDDLDD